MPLLHKLKLRRISVTRALARLSLPQAEAYITAQAKTYATAQAEAHATSDRLNQAISVTRALARLWFAQGKIYATSARFSHIG